MPAALFPALSERNLRIYLSGQSLSVLGMWTQAITFNLLVYQTSGSAALLGIANFLLHGPMLFVAPLAGAKIRPWNAARVAQTVMAVSILNSLAAGTLATLGAIGPSFLLGFAAVAGLLSAVEMPARQVLLTTSASGPAQVPNAVAMNTLCFNLGRMLGPAIAAWLFVRIAPTVGFFVYAATLLVMRRCIGMLALKPEPGAGNGKASFGQALRHVGSDRFFTLFLTIVCLLGIFAGSYQTLIPVLADTVFGDTAAVTGILFSAAGGGSLACALLLSTRHMRTLTGALLLFAPWCCALAVAALASASSLALAMCALSVLGFFLTLTTTATNSLLQRSSPPALRGALAGLYATAFLGMMPIGHLVMGALAAGIGARGALLGASLVLITAFALLYWRKWKADGHIVGALP